MGLHVGVDCQQLDIEKSLLLGELRLMSTSDQFLTCKFNKTALRFDTDSTSTSFGILPRLFQPTHRLPRATTPTHSETVHDVRACPCEDKTAITDSTPTPLITKSKSTFAAIQLPNLTQLFRENRRKVEMGTSLTDMDRREGWQSM